MNSKICIFPGSFNPFHDGHKYVIQKAINTGFKKIVIVIAQNPNKSKNDFNKNKMHINQWIKLNHLENIVSVDICEYLLVDYLKKSEIFTIIRGYRNLKDKIYEKKLINIYRKEMPSIRCIFFKSSKELINISSSR